MHLPHGRAADVVRDALVDTMSSLPAHLARSLTWDRGSSENTRETLGWDAPAERLAKLLTEAS